MFVSLLYGIHEVVQENPNMNKIIAAGTKYIFSALYARYSNAAVNKDLLESDILCINHKLDNLEQRTK